MEAAMMERYAVNPHIHMIGFAHTYGVTKVVW
jgi:hypothetical protein